jgi:hypothetical protein
MSDVLGKLILAFIAFSMVSAAIPSMPGIFTLIFLIILANWVFKNNTSTRSSGRNRNIRYPDERERPSGGRFVTVERPESRRREAVEPYRPVAARSASRSSRDEAYEHALRAAQQADFDVLPDGVLPMDIGVLAYRADDDQPVIIREGQIPDDAAYLQPFLELRVPSAMEGSLNFEVLDHSGNLVYKRRVPHNFARGRNLVLTPTRMRVGEDLSLMDGWHLRVWSGDVMIADHTLNWTDAGTYDEKPIAAHIGEDGELSVELRQALETLTEQPVSLDDLLSSQDDEQVDRRSGRLN